MLYYCTYNVIFRRDYSYSYSYYYITADKTRLTKARNALARAINDAKNTWLCAHAESMNNCIKTNPTVFWSAAKQLVAGLGKAEAPKVMSLKDGEGNKAKTATQRMVTFSGLT